MAAVTIVSGGAVWWTLTRWRQVRCVCSVKTVIRTWVLQKWFLTMGRYRSLPSSIYWESRSVAFITWYLGGRSHQLKEHIKRLRLVVLRTRRHRFCQALDDKEVDTEAAGVVRLEHLAWLLQHRRHDTGVCTVLRQSTRSWITITHTLV